MSLKDAQRLLNVMVYGILYPLLRSMMPNASEMKNTMMDTGKRSDDRHIPRTFFSCWLVLSVVALRFRLSPCRCRIDFDRALQKSVDLEHHFLWTTVQ